LSSMPFNLIQSPQKPTKIWSFLLHLGAFYFGMNWCLCSDHAYSPWRLTIAINRTHYRRAVRDCP
jgi:hypothetical protein